MNPAELEKIKDWDLYIARYELKHIFLMLELSSIIFLKIDKKLKEIEEKLKW